MKNERQDEVLKYLNELLQRDGLNIGLQISYETMSCFGQIIKQQYAAGSFDS